MVIHTSLDFVLTSIPWQCLYFFKYQTEAFLSNHWDKKKGISSTVYFCFFQKTNTVLCFMWFGISFLCLAIILILWTEKWNLHLVFLWAFVYLPGILRYGFWYLVVFHRFLVTWACTVYQLGSIASFWLASYQVSRRLVWDSFMYFLFWQWIR